MMPLLEVEGLAHHFGAVQALTHIDMHVEDGEVLAIIGPNGCGKTTLFNCISGRFAPTRGKIWWAGENITGMPMHQIAQRGLVRTFQEIRVFRSGTPRSNLEMASAAARRQRDGADAALVFQDLGALLELCGLTERADAPVTELPHGYLRRLGVAVALTAKPRLLLLDEPAAGMNNAEQGQFAQLLHALHERGLTLAIIDHDMDFLLPLAHRVIVLANGEKLCEGAPEKVRVDPAVIEVYLGKSASLVHDFLKLNT